MSREEKISQTRSIGRFFLVLMLMVALLWVGEVRSAPSKPEYPYQLTITRYGREEGTGVYVFCDHGNLIYLSEPRRFGAGAWTAAPARVETVAGGCR